MLYLKQYFLTLLIIISTLDLYAQKVETDELLINQHDMVIGKGNLSLFNGSVHINKDVTVGDQTRYLYPDFHSATVYYERQPYYHIQIKYDIYNDILVLQPTNSSSAIGINAITEKVDSFYLEKKEQLFLNLRKLNIAGAASGYYECILPRRKIELYVKHFKTLNNIELTEDEALLDYKYGTRFYMVYEQHIYNLDGMKSVVDLFPEWSSKIEGFYESHTRQEKKEELLFYKDLISWLNTIYN